MTEELDGKRMALENSNFQDNLIKVTEFIDEKRLKNALMHNEVASFLFEC